MAVKAYGRYCRMSLPPRRDLWSEQETRKKCPLLAGIRRIYLCIDPDFRLAKRCGWSYSQVGRRIDETRTWIHDRRGVTSRSSFRVTLKSPPGGHRLSRRLTITPVQSPRGRIYLRRPATVSSPFAIELKKGRTRTLRHSELTTDFHGGVENLNKE